MMDVLIIGCGIIGAAAAYELSRYDLSVTVVDRLNDIAGETTRANSGLIHAGFDPEPGSAMAKLNVRGAELTRELCAKLDVPYKQNGAFVVGFDDKDKAVIDKLYRQGVKNGVQGLEVITGEQARVLEPRLSKEITYALSAPDAAVISPWDYAIALAETAARNGTRFVLGAEVTKIKKTDTGFTVTTSKGEFETKTIVNAAGLYADEVHGFLQKPDFKIIPNRGEYFLLDKSAGATVTRTIFQCPNEFGKGIVVTPTVHGNLLIGPSSEGVDDPADAATSAASLERVWETAAKSVPGLSKRDNIRNFAGVRANADVSDFIIREACAGFYDLAGIKSPGLSAAPAIAEALVGLMEAAGTGLVKKAQFIDRREVVRFPYLNAEARAKLIKEKPAYGRIVCRCESITEGEIDAALNSSVPPRSIDGVKRRCGAGMGRCQGGFCSPRVLELLASHYQCGPTQINQDGAGSHVLV
jgi:glycerol-3-phosphate dehydrogenase